jgi:ubiquinone/menaquinone biosynthesis C-methylase UbiE
MRRREVFGLAAGSALVAHQLRGELAEAQEYFSAISAPGAPQGKPGSVVGSKGVLARGTDGRLPRLGSLDLESQQDFTLGFRLMHGKTIRAASMAAFDRLLQARGIDPTAPMTMDEMRALVENDPAINLTSKAWLANQQITWKSLRDHYYANSDYYLSEMEAADKSGPGTLELAPKMTIPDYARHEIHIQPGGYVGDPFAGHIYHYGTNSFYISVIGNNEQDQVHKGTVARLPLPADGKVRRILDYGCGAGQMTVALKERFPDAEVWGIDVGGPMVRYAHMRARKLGVAVNFAQRLAEDTQFPDGYFDMVVSYIAHHEFPAEISRKVVDEARRLTRGRGVYYPVDFNNGGTAGTPRGLYGRWWDHRWNNEVWSLEYHALDFNSAIASGGFTFVKETKAALPGFGARHFVKSA